MTKKKDGPHKKRGPHPKYDPKRHPRIVLSHARKGKTQEEIAAALGIVYRTFVEWRKKYPEIDQALRDGREVAVAQIEESMFARAIGTKVVERKIIELPDGSQKKEITEKELPPDPVAGKLLLQAWSDEYKEKMEHSGPGGEPIRIEVVRVANCNPAEN